MLTVLYKSGVMIWNIPSYGACMISWSWLLRDVLDHDSLSMLRCSDKSAIKSPENHISRSEVRPSSSQDFRLQVQGHKISKSSISCAFRLTFQVCASSLLRQQVKTRLVCSQIPAGPQTIVLRKRVKQLQPALLRPLCHSKVNELRQQMQQLRIR